MYGVRGNFEKAEELQSTVVEETRKMLSAEDPKVLHSVAFLALVYQKQGRLEEATNLYNEREELAKRVLCIEHHLILDSMRDLAIGYLHLRRQEDAKKLLVQIVDASQRVPRPNSPEILSAKYFLTGVQYLLKKHSEATGLMNNILELQTEILGSDHPNAKD